jgi:hypothetical protein
MRFFFEVGTSILNNKHLIRNLILLKGVRKKQNLSLKTVKLSAMKDKPEFEAFNYENEVQKINASIKLCKKILSSNKIQAIPSFNEIMERELEAVIDTLNIGHFHAAARCTRAALELAAGNLCLYFKVSGSRRLINISFAKKYTLKGLTHKKKSPLLDLITIGVIDDLMFDAFRETYGELSSYVHYRVTYHLCHVIPEQIRSAHNYSEALRLSGKNDELGKLVKATMVNRTLGSAFEVLHLFLKSHQSLSKNK